MSSRPALVVEVFADIWCPFAFVGLQYVRAYRNEHAPGSPIRVRAWPLELVNGAPMDVTKTAQHVSDLREQLGVDCFKGFREASFPKTTLPALALVAAAERDGPSMAEKASFRIREALWEDGLDVGEDSVLSALASEFGVGVTAADIATVLDDWTEGQARGVQGSPHFFCGSRNEFCPSLSMVRDPSGLLRVEPDPSQLEAFLKTCWPS